MDTRNPSAAMVGLAVALGIGLVVGIERERRKAQGDRRTAAGLRTFAIAAVAGAVAQVIQAGSLVPIGGALVAALAVVSHWKSRSRDPGMTTELALFATYLIGVLCVIDPALGAACGTGLALLLAARRRLHRFATELLSEQELHDGVLLAALALIVLPFIPAGPIDMLGGIAARPLAAMVLVIMAIQAGQAAVRWLGVRGGLLAAGFASGFVSSTASRQPQDVRLLAGAAALSAVATWVLALAMTTALSPRRASHCRWQQPVPPVPRPWACCRSWRRRHRLPPGADRSKRPRTPAARCAPVKRSLSRSPWPWSRCSWAQPSATSATPGCSSVSRSQRWSTRMHRWPRSPRCTRPATCRRSASSSACSSRSAPTRSRAAPWR